MQLKHKQTGEIVTSSKFNIHTCAPQEIIVYGTDWMDTDYMANYDAVLVDGTFKDLGQAMKDGDVEVDDINTQFWLAHNNDK